MKKFLLTMCFTALAVCLLMLAVSAEVFKVTYYDGGTVKETVQTDENGTITLRTERYSEASAPVFNWFTYEGDVFAPGETITITKDTDIRQFCALESTNKDLNVTDSLWSWRYIQLQEDLYLEKSLAVPDGGRLYIDLNGYNIYTSANHAFEQRRAGLFIVGKGSIIHTGNGHIFNSSLHGYGDGNMGMVVGKDVTISTKGNVFNQTNNFSSGHISSSVPLEFYGNITCNRLIYFGGIVNELLGMVISPTKLTVLGDCVVKYSSFGDEGSVNLTIGAGTFELTEAANNKAYWIGEFDDKHTVTVNGGSFTHGADVILGYAPDGSKLIATSVGEKEYSSVIFSGCPHAYDVVSTTNATCITIQSATYECPVCNHSFVVSTGEFVEHIYEMIAHEPATAISVGKKTYECTVCQKIYIQEYSIDPSDVVISIIVSVENEYKQIDVKASDVFEFSISEQMGMNIYTLVGLKDFSEYLASDIISIEIPVGVANFNFEQNNSTLKMVSVLDYANVTFVSFSKCTALTEINIGKSTVYFNNGASNNVIQTIRSNKEGANVGFAANVFNGKKSLTSLVMSPYSIYDFGANSFKESGLKELVFPDYSEPFFRDEAAFYNCAAEYIYVGKGITKLMGKPFDYCQKVQKIVLMEVTSFTHEYTFCVENAGEKPVEVYIHSEAITLPNNTFYQCHGIIVYTNAPITNANAFAQCNATTKGGVDYPSYTIVYGIPHKYTPGSSEPTCTANGSVGYTTDCPCGVVAEAEYKTFVSTTTDGSYTEGVIETTVIAALGHLQGTLVDVNYNNGYLQGGVARYDCMRCDNNGYYEEQLAPMVKCLGYSICEFGNSFGMIQGYTIDEYAFGTVKQINESFSYGIVAAGNVVGDTRYPLTIENGKLVAENGVMLVPISVNLNQIDIKISGSSEEWKNVSLIICMYIFDGVSVKYADNGNISTGITGITYNSLVTE